MLLLSMRKRSKLKDLKEKLDWKLQDKKLLNFKKKEKKNSNY